MITVFLSHASQDKPLVRELATYLEIDKEIKVWFDEREIAPSDEIFDEISDGLEADFVLLILTTHSVESKWVKKEWTAAFNEHKLAVAQCDDCKVLPLLRTAKYFDLRTNQPKGFREIRSWLLNERPAPPQSFHAPARPPLFVGRAEELEQLREKLGQPGALVHLQGMPGKGKTTLALAFAHRYRQDFEAVYWVPCQSGNLALIAGELAVQLGVKLEGDLESNTRDLRDLCARKRCLLVLDNVEEEGPEQLIPGGNASTLVTTRRDDLKFLHWRAPVPLPLFTEEQCFEVFRTVVGSKEVDRHEAICRQFFHRLEYLPMAIAVSAGLVRYDARYTIPRIAGTLPASVTELIAKAVAALPGSAKGLLTAMSACAPEGFRLALASKVASLSEDDSLDALQELVSRSLVEELDRTDRRYRLHALVREAAYSADSSLRHAEVMNQQFQAWQSDWRTCVLDLPDFLVALRWAIAAEATKPVPFIQTLAFSGYDLAESTGRPAEAFEICERMRSLAEFTENRERMHAWLGNQALILRAWGRLDEAMALHKQEEAICQELGDQPGLQRSYGNQALILQNWGRLDQAMALLKQQEAICEKLGHRAGLQLSYGNQALILRAWGRLEEAMALHKKEETICQELGDRGGLQASYGNQALILQDWGRLHHAMALLKQQEAICQKLGDRAGLQRSYGNRALILKAWGRLEEAMALHKQEEAICEELGDRAGLQASYGNQALILQDWGRLDEAMALHKKQEAICQELGDRADLQASYGNQALILQDWGRLDEAIALLRQQEAICQELGDRAGLARADHNMARILQQQGKLPEARALAAGALAMFRELNMPRETEKAQRLIDSLGPPTA